MKKNVRTLRGGGENKSLNSLTSTQASNLDSRGIFKPLIATSLALALGVSVVSGTEASTCTSTSGAPAICLGDSGADVSSSSFGITWNGVSSSPAGGTNTDVYQPALTSGKKPIQNLIFQFNDSSNHSGDENAYTASTNQNKITINGGDNAIQMKDGSGTLKIDFNGTKNDTKTFILDLSGTTNATYSFVGNIETSYGTSKTYSKTRSFSAIFGKSVKGNITLNGGARAFGGDDGTPTALTFKNDAKLEGNLTVGYDDAGVVFEGNGSITGNVVKNDGGKLLLSFNGTGGIGGTISSTAGVAEITYGSGNQKIQLNGDQRGVLSFIYGDSVTSKIISVDNLASFDASSSPTISSGDIVFDGVSQVIFNSTSSKTTGNGTLYIAPKDSNQNGSVEFRLDSSAGTSSSSPILKGSISANYGSIIFALKDVSGETGSNPFTNPNAVAPTKTYYVDGNITIDNGGLSAFWDDSIGFYGKIKATDSYKIEQTGGFIGKNDAWFEKGTITSSIPTIQATSGASHLVFEDNITIGEVNDSGENVSIKNHNANLMVIFKGSSNTITGNIKNTGEYSNSSVTNLLIFENGDNQILSEKIHFIDKYVKNIIVLNGKTSKVGSDRKKTNLLIEFNLANNGATNEWEGENAIVANSSKSNTLTFREIKIKGNYGGHTEKTAEKTLNIISLNQDGATNSLSANSIQTTYGNTIIGKSIMDGSGNFNTDFFSNNTSPFPISKNNFPMLKEDFATTFMNDEYTAKGSYTFGNQLNGDTIIADISGNNYINVSKAIINGNVKANTGGANYIYTNDSSSSISKDVIANGGSNHITFKQKGSIGGAVTADGGNNSITFEQGGSIDGNISTTKGGNTVVLEGSNVSTIKGDILSQGTNSSSNVITAKKLTFNGTNQKIVTGTSSKANFTTKNLITLQGETTFSDNMTIQALSSYSKRKKENIIKFDTGSSIASNTWNISELTASMDEGSAQNSGNPSNILDFGTISGANITIGSINKKDTISSNGGKTGFNYIGKGFTKGSGTTLGLADNLSTDWANNTHTADITLKVSDDIYSNRSGNYNYINVSTLQANTLTSEDGANNISVGTSGEISGNITTSGNGQNNFTLNADSADLTLKGKTSGGTTHQITALNATGGNNTLTLDNSTSTSGAMVTKIHSIGNGENLAVILKGQGTGKGVTLTLDNATGTTLKSVSLGASSTENTLAFTNGSNKVNTAISVGDAQALTIELSGGNTTSLNLAKGFSKTGNGTANIAVKTASTNATLSGGVINASALSFENNASLAIRNANATFESASGNGVLILDSANAGASVKVTVNTEVNNGSNLTAQFNGNTERGNELILNNGGTLKAVTLGANSTNNTLAIKGSSKTTTITDKVDATQGTGITFDLGNSTTLDLKAGADSRLSAEESKGAITLKLQDNATATISGSATNITNLDFTGSSAQTLNVKNSSISFGTITANNANGSKLVLDTTSNKVDTSIGTITGNNLDVELNGNSLGATLTINGNGGTIKSIKVTNGDASANIINFNSGTTTITNAIDKTAVDTGKGLALNLNGGNAFLRGNLNTTNGGGTINVTLDNSSTLSLGGATNTIKKLTATNGTIDLSSSITSSAKEARSTSDATARKTLTIGGTNDKSAFSGNLNFVTYANTKTADRIIVDGTDSSGTITIFAKGELYEVLSITREDNIKVAEIENSVTKNGDPSSASGTNNITVKGGESEIDGIVFDLVVQEDESNKGNYYLGKTIDKGVDTSIQKVASTALTVNYDLYLANFNSLNKRMGELRDNPYNQGVWARVFGGAMSNDFGAGSKTNYVTAQAGYDYSLTLSNARNYMGVAIAYGKSWTKSNEVTALSNAYLSNVDSNMVEVGIYNSFVMDSGWYNDTILKFDYIMSDFTLKAGSVSADNHTNNFAMVLSDEFGYRYKFGSEKSWYIDPQVEVGFGYFNQSDFNHALSSSGRTKLEASQDSILTLRTRAGMSLGKKFTTQKGFASVYVGAFYEYDYIEGGNATTLATGVSNTLNQVGSNGRTIVNVGSNIELTDGVRMYIDVEKSFGDKQRTFMQFNFGARYSFGEKTLSTQHKTNSAPLKIENQTSQEQSEQTSSQEQNTSSKE